MCPELHRAVAHYVTEDVSHASCRTQLTVPLYLGDRPGLSAHARQLGCSDGRSCARASDFIYDRLRSAQHSWQASRSSYSLVPCSA